MELPWAYSLWQAPFLKAKFAPIVAHNDLARSSGSWTWAAVQARMRRSSHIPNTLVSISIRPISSGPADGIRVRSWRRTCVRIARRRKSRYDFVLLNSLLHHIDDESADRILAAISEVVVDDGCVHVIDLILPERRGIARYLTESDRGDYPRPWHVWQELLSRYFEPLVDQPFPVGMAGVELWQMLYFKGRPRK